MSLAVPTKLVLEPETAASASIVGSVIVVTGGVLPTALLIGDNGSVAIAAAVGVMVAVRFIGPRASSHVGYAECDAFNVPFDVSLGDGALSTRDFAGFGGIGDTNNLLAAVVTPGACNGCSYIRLFVAIMEADGDSGFPTTAVVSTLLPSRSPTWKANCSSSPIICISVSVMPPLSVTVSWTS